MKQVVTKQGKTFDYSEILLFNRVDDKIVVMLNDKEQLDKFSLTGNIKDAPIAVIPYSEDELKEIVSHMKLIAGYTEFNSNKICVEYCDTTLTRVEFAKSNKEIIENNLIEQRKLRENNLIGNWYEVAENKEVSDVITEEQRFKVLQIEKYENQEKEYKEIATTDFYIACFLALFAILCTNNMSARVSSGLTSIIFMIKISLTIAKKAKVSLKKEDLINELKNAGVDIDVIRDEIEKEEAKWKGAK